MTQEAQEAQEAQATRAGPDAPDAGRDPPWRSFPTVPVVSEGGFLTAAECAVLSAYLETNVRRLGRRNIEPFFSYRQISYAGVDSPRVRKIMDRARRRIAGILSDGLHGDAVYPEYTDLVLWREGQHMNVHRDDLPPHFGHRLYSSILYLTSCHGGATVFPTAGIEVPPEAGRMIAFPSSLPHGVRPVVSGRRHTLASWYTGDAERRER